MGEVPFERDRRAMAAWLFAVCALTIAMVILGGITRLTESGLSIVEWKPVTGVLPPLGEDAWEAEFAKYREFPEYKEVNQGLTLDGFRRIFWLEYLHRLLGRGIGLAFLAPFVVFLARMAIPRPLARRMVALFALGALQGVVGWWMVKSGLVDRPDVSHYRLTVHLGLALVLMLALFSTALDLARGSVTPVEKPDRVAVATLALLVAAFTTALSGGLVAGKGAGFAWNTFPLMAGHLVPPGMWAMRPWYLNPFENLLTVQFDHRLLAVATAVGGIGLRLGARRHPAARALGRVAAALAVQVALGISTLLSVVWTPLALAHQAGALAVLLLLAWAAHEQWRPSKREP